MMNLIAEMMRSHTDFSEFRLVLQMSDTVKSFSDLILIFVNMFNHVLQGYSNNQENDKD